MPRRRSEKAMPSAMSAPSPSSVAPAWPRTFKIAASASMIPAP
jgi:hypothetical protein